MKRKISLILIFLLICIVTLAACGGSSGSSSSSGTATNTDTNLADNINEIFQSGTYQMDITTVVENDSESYEINMIIAVDEGDMAGQYTFEGTTINFVLKDNMYYLIYNDQKMIMSFEADSSDEANMIDLPSVEDLSDDGMAFTNQSEVVIDGETLICEEYSISSDEAVKYYFKDNTLVRMEIISGSYTQIMKINEIKGTVDSELFEIPSNYQQMSM
jgi:hypothetical protein